MMDVTATAAADQGNRNTSAHRWLLFFTALYTFLFAGAVLGWGPMQLLLETNGSFHYLCSDSYAIDEVCPEQTARLITVQSTSQLMFFLSPFLGAIADRYGSSMLMSILAASGMVGVILLLIVAHTGVDVLLFPAFIGLGMVAVSTSIMIVQTSFELQGKLRVRAISGLNALFDAGSITYLALWELKKAFNISLSSLVTGYMVVGLFSFGGAIYFWRVVRLKKNELCALKADTAEAVKNVTSSQEKRMGDLSFDQEKSDDDISKENDKESVKYSEVRELSVVCSNEEEDSDKSHHDEKVVGKCPEEEERNLPSSIGQTNIADSLPESDEETGEMSLKLNDYVPIASRIARRQLCSKLFLILMLYYAFYLSKNLFVLTTARDFLGDLGDDDKDNKYLIIFSLLMPASLVAVPFVNYAIETYGYHAALQSVNVLALLHGLIQTCSEDLNVQVIGFVSFTFFRCFLFAVVFNFMASFMSSDATGKGAGFLNLAGGICLFCNIPLVNLAVLAYDSFFIPNLLYTIPIVPLFWATYIMIRWAKQDKEAVT